MTTYTNRDGGDTIFGIKAQAVGEELERIRETRGGEIQPKDVVDAAQSPDNVLHGVFTWDDAEAAFAHRLWQARQLIKSVSFVIHRDNERTIAPSYLNVPATENGERHYQATKVVITRDSEWGAALKVLYAKAQGIHSTIATLTALATTLKRDTKQINKAATHFERGINVVGTMIEKSETRPRA